MQKKRIGTSLSTSALALTVSSVLPMTGIAADLAEPYQATETQSELELTKAKADVEKTYKVDESSSVKLTQPIADTPRTITVIPSTMLEDQGITSLNDALRNVAGVSTFGGGEGGGGTVTTSDSVSIRGFDASSSIYIDGIRDIGGYSRDMFNYDQVEVIKGASGSIDGRTNGGGSLNLSTKRAQLDDFGSVSGRYDNFDTGRVTADVNKQLSDNTAARFNLVYSDGGDVFDNGRENYETLGLAGSFFYQATPDTDVTLDVFYMDQDNTPILGLPYVTADAAEASGLDEGPIDSSYWSNYYSVDGRDYEDIDTGMITLLVNHKVNDNLSLRSQTRYGSNDKKSVIGRPWWGSDDEAGLLDATKIQSLDEESDLFVTQFDGLFTFEQDNIAHNLVIGAEYAKEKLTSYGLDADYTYTVDGEVVDTPYIDPTNPLNNIEVSGSVVRNGEDTVGDADTIAIYAFDSISIGEQYQLDVNARLDDYEIEGETCSRGTCATGLSADATFFSYGVAFSYMPTENGSIYVSYGNSEEPPGTELALSTSADSNSLDPQDAETMELGTKWELFDGDLLLTAAIFKTTKDVEDSESITDDDGNSSTYYYLTGEQESKGFEIGVVGNLTDNLSISANYAKLDTETTQDLDPDEVGNGLQAAPDDTATVWLSYSAMDDKLNLGGGLYYNSGETYWRQQTAYFTVDAYTTASLMASYQVTPALKVQVNIDNLFDEEYVTDFSAKGHFRPGDPRSFAVYASYNF
ncbi:TonB-dependent siderophore receptor [Alteromonas sp. 14N.309.X.WAT.G.H12]|uniref:TonB-dependent receptor n=1 Tax=Alteromonas sp. 14N.309.X.WAT.G.H12 TaxID=3120824 RepID=UPI002FD23627